MGLTRTFWTLIQKSTRIGSSIFKILFIFFFKFVYLSAFSAIFNTKTKLSINYHLLTSMHVTPLQGFNYLPKVSSQQKFWFCKHCHIKQTILANKNVYASVLLFTQPVVFN